MFQDGKYEEPSWLTMESRRLIRSMLQIDPQKRIRVDELLNHPWVMRGHRGPVSINDSCNVGIVSICFLPVLSLVLILTLLIQILLLDERTGQSVCKFAG